MLQSGMITMEHGSGGQATGELIGEVFASAFDSEVLNRMEDSAVVPGSGRIAVTTDSFVVTPLVFRGGVADLSWRRALRSPCSGRS